MKQSPFSVTIPTVIYKMIPCFHVKHPNTYFLISSNNQTFLYSILLLPKTSKSPLSFSLNKSYVFKSLQLLTIFGLILQQMNFSNMRKKRTAQANQAPSKVLLTCVYDTIVLEITNQLVYSKFSPFGTIIRILIFERGQVTKFFIEYEHLPNAIQAKKSLDGTKLYEAICKMNIYYSNFSSVDLKHQTTQGVALQQNLIEYKNNLGRIGQDSKNDGTGIDERGKKPLFNSILLFDCNNGSQYFSDLQETIQINEQQPVLKESNKQNLLAIELEKIIKSDIDSLLKSQRKKVREDSKENYDDNNRSAANDHFIAFKLEEYVENHKIYNLFSNFGNISYIKQTKNMVYLKYRSREYVDIAKTYLEGTVFRGNVLSLQSIKDTKRALPSQEQFSQVNYYDSCSDRFTINRSITINPPSRTLHVSSLKRQCCRTDYLKQLFQRYGKIQKVQLISANNSQKNMALIQFLKIQESFDAISQMHGRNIGGRKIQISFTKSRLY